MIKKKATKKAPGKKAITPTVEAPKVKKLEEKKPTAKVSKGQIIEVIVTAEKFGTYKKGDVIKMHQTTAKACIDSKVVKEK